MPARTRMGTLMFVLFFCSPAYPSRKRVLKMLSDVLRAHVKTRLKCRARSAWEVGLHPSSYRGQMCTYGACCTRRMCFFAHDPSQLRVDAAMKYIEMEQAQFGISELWRLEGRSELWRPEGRVHVRIFCNAAASLFEILLQAALRFQRV